MLISYFAGWVYQGRGNRDRIRTYRRPSPASTFSASNFIPPPSTMFSGRYHALLTSALVFLALRSVTCPALVIQDDPLLLASSASVRGERETLSEAGMLSSLSPYRVHTRERCSYSSSFGVDFFVFPLHILQAVHARELIQYSSVIHQAINSRFDKQDSNI